MTDKIYFNSITIKEGKYGLKVSINYNKFMQEAQQNLNQNGYINLDINKRKQKGKFGETHYTTLNTWTPEKKQEIDNEPDEYKAADNSSLPGTDDDLPFN